MNAALELIDGSVNLPSLPAIVVRLNQLLTSRVPAMKEVAELISEDPALAARVLRIVNSPLFPYRTPIDSIQRAVTLLGVRELRNLALAASARELSNGAAAGLLDTGRFWRHSLLCALIARGLAEATRQQDVDRYFVLGLLHDVGILVICDQRPDKAAAILAEARELGVPLAEAESAILGYTHAEVAAALLSSWDLPETLFGPIAAHHQRSPQGPHRFAATLLHVADLLTGTVEDGEFDMPSHIAPLDDDWSALGIPAVRCGPIVEAAVNQFDMAQQALFGAVA